MNNPLIKKILKYNLVIHRIRKNKIKGSMLPKIHYFDFLEAQNSLKYAENTVKWPILQKYGIL